MDQYDIVVSVKLINLTWLKRFGLILIWLGCKLNGYSFEAK